MLYYQRPPDPAPGITGWAQVNGGTLLTPSEKDALDEWYLRNASLWLDCRIILMTARVMIWGQHRPEDALARAQAMTVRNEPVWSEAIRPEGIALEAAMVPRPYNGALGYAAEGAALTCTAAYHISLDLTQTPGSLHRRPSCRHAARGCA